MRAMQGGRRFCAGCGIPDRGAADLDSRHGDGLGHSFPVGHPRPVSLLLPPSWRPEAFGTYIPGVGIILSFLLLVLTGIVVRNLFGGQIVKGFENLVRRIPVIGAVYGGAKTFSETVLTDKGKSFKQVVMVEFPRKGIFSIGFITSEELEEVQAKTAQDVVCVFVPTTPNPTTGFIVLVPRDEVVRLDMTVDEAVKMLLTLGVVVPKWNNKPVVADLAPQQPPP
jgi:uncharacterized membrane protein